MATTSIRLGPKLKELRLHLCQTSATSQGLRNFIHENYVNIKRLNPHFPMLVRECSGITPKIWARYDFGKEQHFDVENMNSKEILQLISNLESRNAS